MPNEHDNHVSGDELSRTVSGFTKAMEIGFDGIHRRFDEQGERMTRIEQAAADVKQTIGAHGAQIDNLWHRVSMHEKRSLGVARAPGPIAAAAADEDTKPALTFGDLKRLADAGRVVWPVVFAAGSALATWMMTKWGS